MGINCYFVAAGVNLILKGVADATNMLISTATDRLCMEDPAARPDWGRFLTRRWVTGLVIILLSMGLFVAVVAVGGAAGEPAEEDVSMTTYASNDGDTATVEIEGLLDALADFRADEIPTTTLLDVLDRFRSGEPVVAATLTNATAVHGETLTVPSATFTEDEFAVVIQESDDGDPGEVIGESEPQDAGTVTETEINLSETIEKPGEELVAVVHHADVANGTIGSPVTVENDSIASTAFVDTKTAVFDITEFEAPDSITETESYAVNATVENVGNATDTRTVAYRIAEDSEDITDAEETATANVSLEPGEIETIPFELDPPEENDLTPGPHNHGLFTPAANATAPVAVVETLEEITLEIDGEDDVVSIGAGETVSYAVTGQFSNGSEVTLTEEASVTSGAPALVSVNETATALTGEAIGENVTVTATVENESDTTSVTVESIGVNASLAPTATDAFLITDQPGASEAGESFELDYQLTGAETLTITLRENTTVDPAHLSFDIGGTTVGVNETYEFDDPPAESRVTVVVSVDESADSGGIVRLAHTVAGEEDERTLNTGPTELTDQTTADGADWTDVDGSETGTSPNQQSDTDQFVLKLADSAPELADERTTSEQLKHQATHAQPSVVETVETMEGATVTGTLWLVNAVVVSIESEQLTASALAAIDGVEHVHPNYEYTIPEPIESSNAGSDVSSDTDVTYGLDQINAPDAWEEFDNRGDDIRVAVLDTGVAEAHPDIDIEPADFAEFDSSGNEAPGEHCSDDICDTGYHGTHVSGTVVGGNASGESIGVAPDATLMHGLVLPGGGGTWAQITSGIQWAVEEDADVVSMSLGGGISNELVTPMENAIDAGTIVVASSGNDGSGTASSPGADRSSLAVGATDPTGQVAGFSSGRLIETENAYGFPPDAYPSLYLVPDVVAPGAFVKSAIPDGQSGPPWTDCDSDDIYCKLSGTSMAAPHVSGAMAVALSNTDTAIGHDEMYNLLASTATKPDEAPLSQDTRFGHGIIDVYAATDAAGTATTITGTLTDAETGEPIPGATVTVQETGERVDTDADGSYELPTHADSVTIQADAFGYSPAHELSVVGR